MLIADVLDWYLGWLVTLLYDIAGFGIIDNLKDMISLMTENYNTAFNSIASFADTVKTVAIMLVFVHFLCYVLEMSTKEQLTMDVFFKGFLKFLIAFFFVQQCVPLFQLLMKLGNAMMDEIVEGLTGDEGAFSLEELKIEAKAYFLETNFGGFTEGPLSGKFWASFFSVIPFVLQQLLLQLPTTLIMWLMNWIFVLVASLVFVSRALELAVRTVFSPIAIVDIFENGTGGSGLRYVKKFLAVAIQGAVVIMIVALVGPLSGQDASNASEFCKNTMINPNLTEFNFGDILASGFTLIIYKIAAIGLIFKSQPICNDIMGV